MIVKLDHFPRDRGENKKYVKPTTLYRLYRFLKGRHGCPRKDPKDLLLFKAIGILLEGGYGVRPKEHRIKRIEDKPTDTES